MEEQKATPLSGEKISHVLTRISLALVFLSFGYVQLQSPAGWVSYLPGILQRLPIDGQFFIFLNGTMEILLGLFLLLGIYIRPAAFVLGIHLFAIAATIGFNAVGIRDFGLSLATLGVAFAGNDSFSLARYIRDRKAAGRGVAVFAVYAALFMLAGSALAFSIQMYTGPVLSARTADDKTGTMPAVNVPTGTVLSAQVISTHASATDCWIIVSNRVYSVAQYVPYHPGGEKRITDLCGNDATTAFATKGGMGNDHSSNAKTLLEKYFVGVVGATVSAGKTTAATAGDSGGVTATPSVAQTPTPTPVVTPTPAPATALTSAAVATHNSASNCWIIVSGNVYNVTAYIPFHPGGTSRITNTCGQDATTVFNNRGGTGSHSSNARSLLANYLVGALGSTVTPTPVGATPPPPPPNSGDDDEWDD